ncbi:hypothetical protein PHISCL_08064 [Aspergillus sclerotialis]|uniref:Phenol hydroxylase-like C-terminal dimerisation domain-containing protein n=1 Tax=Aspergillus sclerotialis TaxID=2070753 RepID=A0A3A2ZJQ2_9EURO|nr:hypothetical protein PHISCL_08064 [Aspergillus sclerotialis]
MADPVILETYDSERRPVAEELMEMDRYLVQAYEQDNNALDAVEEIRRRYSGFMSGVPITYQPSVLVSGPKECDGDTSFAKGIKLGMRLPSFPVIRQADGVCIPLADTLASDGSWRLVAFPGDIRQPKTMKRLTDFSEDFSKLSHLSPVIREGFPLIGTVLVHSSPRLSVNILDLPNVFRPFDETLGYDYWRVFADDAEIDMASGPAYKGYGIQGDRELLVLCRPDQHVAWIGGMEETAALNCFFEGFAEKRG